MGFADRFWWGTTSTSLQAEGVAPAADWSVWERDERVPRSGVGAGFGVDFRSDLAQLAELGLTHVRITLEWARIEPVVHKTDSDAIDHYLDVLKAASDVGVNAIATLVAGTQPGWFADDEGGFADERGRDYLWARHVDRCADRFGHQVAGWVPIEDPVGLAVRGHLLGSRPPGRRNPERAAEMIEATLAANRSAAQLLGSGAAPVIGVFGLPTVFGHGPDAGRAVREWDQRLWGSWLGAERDGELVIPGRPAREVADWESSFDVIGFTHDGPIGVDRDGALHPYPADGRRSDTGLVPVVDEVAVVVERLHDALPGRQILVAGHGVSTADDDWRDEILRETLGLLAGMIDDGIPLIGYFHDTAIDGYEGPYGRSTQRGLIDYDRNPKPSAATLGQLIRANG